MKPQVSLSLVLFLCVVIFPVVIPVNASTDAQEKSFAVTPIPFWTTETDYTDISFTNSDTVLFANDPKIEYHEGDYYHSSAGVIETGISYSGSHTDTHTTSGFWGVSTSLAFDMIIFCYLEFSVPITTYEFKYSSYLRNTWIDWGYRKVYNFETSFWETLGSFTSSLVWYNGTITGTEYVSSEGKIRLGYHSQYVNTYTPRTYVYYADVKPKYTTSLFEDGEFTVDIPLTTMKDIKFGTMLDFSGLNGSVSIDFFHGGKNSGLDTEINGTAKLLTYANNELDFSGYDILRLDYTNTYSRNIYRLVITSHNSTIKLADFYYSGSVRKLTNKIQFSSNDFKDNMTMFYLNGDIRYTSDWVIEDSNAEPDIANYLQSLDTVVNSNTDHIKSFSLMTSSFQFIRTEASHYTVGVYGGGDYGWVWQRLNVTFFYPNGTELYHVVFWIDSNNDVSGYSLIGVEVFKHGSLVYSFGGQVERALSNAAYVEGKFGVWRTQEDRIGVKFSNSYRVSGGSESGGFWTGLENYTYWQSEETLENYQAKISVDYRLLNNGISDLVFQANYRGFEYAYGNLAGVSEPHFSTNWWDSIPIVGWIINGFIWVGNMIIAGLSAAFSAIIGGLLALFTPIINSVISVIQGVANAVWGFFSSLLNSIYSAILNVASSIWGFFSSVLDSIFSIIQDVVDGIYTWVYNALEDTIDFIIGGALMDMITALISGFVSLLVGFVDFLGEIFGIADLGTSLANLFVQFGNAIAGVINMFSALLSIAANVIGIIAYYITYMGTPILLLAGLYVSFDIVSNLLDGNLDALTKYTNAASWLFNLMWSIVNSVIQFIGGIIP